MIFTQTDKNGIEVNVTINWLDHAPTCVRCRTVEITRSATFAQACSMGSRLVSEELHKRQLPAEHKKARAITEWAKQAGVFKLRRGDPKAVKSATRYK